jgi:hypothetical protein
VVIVSTLEHVAAQEGEAKEPVAPEGNPETVNETG